MAQRSPFDILPPELVGYCFQLAVEMECRDYGLFSKWTLGPSEGLPARNLLLPIHISSRLRSINLAQPLLWRKMAEKVLATWTPAERPGAEQLFMLCAERASHSLTKLELKNVVVKSCNKRMIDLLATAALSGSTLQDLDLPIDLMPEISECSCEDCCQMALVSPQTAKQRIYDHLYQLLCASSSLQRLELSVPRDLPASTRLLTQPASVQTRPKRLEVRVPGDEVVPVEQLNWLSRLASQSEHLSLCTESWSTRLETGRTDAIRRVYTAIFQASSSTLRCLEIWSDWQDVDLADVFRNGPVQLESLEIHLDGCLGSRPPALPTTLTRFPFNFLTSIEGPSSILRLVVTPNLRYLAVCLVYPNEDGTFIAAQLAGCKDLERLVIGSSIHLRCNQASSSFQTILRALTPAQGQGDVACPKLRRIGITDQHDCSLNWIDLPGEDHPEADEWLYRPSSDSTCSAWTKGGENERTRPAKAL